MSDPNSPSTGDPYSPQPDAGATPSYPVSQPLPTDPAVAARAGYPGAAMPAPETPPVYPDVPQAPGYGQPAQPHGHPAQPAPGYGQPAQPHGHPAQPAPGYGQPARPYSQTHGQYPAPTQNPGVYAAAAYPLPPARGNGLPLTLSIVALIVGVANVVLALVWLAMTYGPTYDVVMAGSALSLVFGGVGILFCLAVGIPALVIAIKRKHKPSLVMSIIAGAATVALIVLTITTFVHGALRSDELESASAPDSPTITATDEPADDGALSDPIAIDWFDGSLAGTTPPTIEWDKSVLDVELTTEGGITALTMSDVAGCHAMLAVTPMPAQMSPSDDEDMSIESIAGNPAWGISPDAELWDLELPWSSDQASSVYLVAADGATANDVTFTGVRVLNSSGSQITMQIMCPDTGIPTANDDAIGTAFDEIYDAVTLVGN